MSSPNTEKVIPYALLGMTAVTGLVDAVSFLSLGRVFTANMTGNIVLLAFATAHVSGLSIARSLTALLAFLVGAILGGRAMARANPDSQIRFAAQAFLLEVAFLFAASFCGIGYRGDLLEHSFQPFALIALTALAIRTRNAAVRKLAIPDLDDNGPDINDYRHRRGLFARERQQPEIGEKDCVGRRNVLGCGVGCSRHTLLDLSSPVACDRNLRRVRCRVVSLPAHTR